MGTNKMIYLAWIQLIVRHRCNRKFYRTNFGSSIFHTAIMIGTSELT